MSILGSEDHCSRDPVQVQSYLLMSFALLRNAEQQPLPHAGVPVICEGHRSTRAFLQMTTSRLRCILAEGAIALSVTLSGGALFAS